MKEKKAGIIIQARMGSTRLPGKVLLPLGKTTILGMQIQRLRSVNVPMYIATSVLPADNELATFATNNEIKCFRGDEANVLDRYYQCAKKYEIDVIIRVTSDCPFIDAFSVSKALKIYTEENNENLYLSNTMERTFPRGLDFEIFSFSLLVEAYKEALDVADKEHVTPFIWKNKSGNVVIKQYKNDFDASSFRLTVDTPEDYELIKKLDSEFGAGSKNGDEIVSLLQQHPELVKINSHIEQKKV